MPTYEFFHSIEECKHEWEVEQSIKAPDPVYCPKCNGGENIIRLISGGSGKGIVELYGQELTDKIKADAQQLKRDAANSEKIYSNLLGESHYENLQRRIDRQKR